MLIVSLDVFDEDVPYLVRELVGKSLLDPTLNCTFCRCHLVFLQTAQNPRNAFQGQNVHMERVEFQSVATGKVSDSLVHDLLING